MPLTPDQVEQNVRAKEFFRKIEESGGDPTKTFGTGGGGSTPSPAKQKEYAAYAGGKKQAEAETLARGGPKVYSGGQLAEPGTPSEPYQPIEQARITRAIEEARREVRRSPKGSERRIAAQTYLLQLQEQEFKEYSKTATAGGMVRLDVPPTVRDFGPNIQQSQADYDKYLLKTAKEHGNPFYDPHAKPGKDQLSQLSLKETQRVSGIVAQEGNPFYDPHAKPMLPKEYLKQQVPFIALKIAKAAALSTVTSQYYMMANKLWEKVEPYDVKYEVPWGKKGREYSLILTGGAFIVGAAVAPAVVVAGVTYPAATAAITSSLLLGPPAYRIGKTLEETKDQALSEAWPLMKFKTQKYYHSGQFAEEYLNPYNVASILGLGFATRSYIKSPKYKTWLKEYRIRQTKPTIETTTGTGRVTQSVISEPKGKIPITRQVKRGYGATEQKIIFTTEYTIQEYQALISRANKQTLSYNIKKWFGAGKIDTAGGTGQIIRGKIYTPQDKNLETLFSFIEPKSKVSGAGALKKLYSPYIDKDVSIVVSKAKGGTFNILGDTYTAKDISQFGLIMEGGKGLSFSEIQFKQIWAPINQRGFRAVYGFHGTKIQPPTPKELSLGLNLKGNLPKGWQAPKIKGKPTPWDFSFYGKDGTFIKARTATAQDVIKALPGVAPQALKSTPAATKQAISPLYTTWLKEFYSNKQAFKVDTQLEQVAFTGRKQDTRQAITPFAMPTYAQIQPTKQLKKTISPTMPKYNFKFDIFQERQQERKLFKDVLGARKQMQRSASSQRQRTAFMPDIPPVPNIPKTPEKIIPIGLGWIPFGSKKTRKKKPGGRIYRYAEKINPIPTDKQLNKMFKSIVGGI